MKIVLFLSRFTFICNIAFVLFVIFSWMENRKAVKAGAGGLSEIPFFKNIVITLGFAAIFVSIIMTIIYIVFSLSKKLRLLPRWLLVTNVSMLLVQVWYFFIR